jgi:hypothetical protein
MGRPQKCHTNEYNDTKDCCIGYYGPCKAAQATTESMQTTELPILHPLQTISWLLSSMVLYCWLNQVIPTKMSFLSNDWMVETILMTLGTTLVDTTCSNGTTTAARRMAFYYLVIDYTPIFCLLVSRDQHRYYVLDNDHNNSSSSL